MDYIYSEAIRLSDEMNNLAIKSIQEENNILQAKDYYQQSINILFYATANLDGLKKARILKRICNIQKVIKDLQ